MTQANDMTANRKMFNQMFGSFPVGRTLGRHWGAQNPATLDAAARVLSDHDANPWVFTGDARHFWQFADKTDAAALAALTADQQSALLGWDDDDDWNPQSFGYAYPS